MQTDMESTLRQLEFARKTPYREVFKEEVGKKIPPTLTDEAIAFVFSASVRQDTENGRIADVLMSSVPSGCYEHFKTLREMKTSHGPFFTRFVLFTKSVIDGLLVGFGTDEMYYVVTTWDSRGYDLWKPEHDLYDRPVLVDKETKTVICLSCHQKVSVVLGKFGDGHVAVCPECNRLAYFD